MAHLFAFGLMILMLSSTAASARTLKSSPAKISVSSAPTGGQIMAASCSQVDVQSAVNSAADGVTVIVPAGTCTWSSAVSISKNTVSLKGAGREAGGTKIVYGGTNHTLVDIQISNKIGRVDISGFWFQGGDADYWNGTAIQAYGPKGWKNLRIHHNTFDNNNRWSIKGSSSTHGLIDNNIFQGSAFGIMLYGEGASDWATPLTLGTADFFFVEDNTFQFNDDYGVTKRPVMDMNSGGRQAFRNNTIKNGMWETHDKARSGLASAHAFEIYNNTFSNTSNQWKGIDVSAGTGAIYGNTFTGDYTVVIGAIDYKSFDPRSVKLCNGSDPADKNVPGESGWICQYQIGSHGEGPTAVSYPLYLWGNKSNNADAGMACTEGCNHVKAGRDFINSTTPKPGYTAYPYPHPLQKP
ncbi:MAG: hypothetical protein AB7N80_11485 [Bdellovibrionales bacterium]